jgi:hypothetical protein
LINSQPPTPNSQGQSTVGQPLERSKAEENNRSRRT